MQTKRIVIYGRDVVLACDAQCSKAWGNTQRPKEILDPNNSDDYAFLADHELGEAPQDPGTYEGGDAKPISPENMNKWCARECERSGTFENAQEIQLSDFSKRVFNIHSKNSSECLV